MTDDAVQIEYDWQHFAAMSAVETVAFAVGVALAIAAARQRGWLRWLMSMLTLALATGGAALMTAAWWDLGSGDNGLFLWLQSHGYLYDLVDWSLPLGVVGLAGSLLLSRRERTA